MDGCNLFVIVARNCFWELFCNRLNFILQLGLAIGFGLFSCSIMEVEKTKLA